MFARLSRLIVIFAALQILGGHWLALQSVAWVRMIANYSNGASLIVAIEKTFDGAHPCSLCKAVKNGRAEEQKEQPVQSLLKFDAILGAVGQMPSPRWEKWQYLGHVSKFFARDLAPPTPPPQLG